MTGTKFELPGHVFRLAGVEYLHMDGRALRKANLVGNVHS